MPGHRPRTPVKGSSATDETQMQALLESMQSECSDTMDQHQLLLVLKDGMLCSLLWQSCFRGLNAGALRLDPIWLPTGESAVLHLIPVSNLQAGSVLHLFPDITKNKKPPKTKRVVTCTASVS